MSRDFPTADRLRDELRSLGVQVDDQVTALHHHSWSECLVTDTQSFLWHCLALLGTACIHVPCRRAPGALDQAAEAAVAVEVEVVAVTAAEAEAAAVVRAQRWTWQP